LRTPDFLRDARRMIIATLAGSTAMPACPMNFILASIIHDDANIDFLTLERVEDFFAFVTQRMTH
jgi:hypothetical protein